ncbi:hypothetical protein [Nonomuraea phyllanthi]|uniref:hypothetical protein n=1 Tax=Nonomuraea phyllanthi TaxID=2219224 RepID=UPI001293324D|nr:hypothetical protein [Nonomuraea phyllanthi]
MGDKRADRVNMAVVLCFRPGQRPHLYDELCADHLHIADLIRARSKIRVPAASF